MCKDILPNSDKSHGRIRNNSPKENEIQELEKNNLSKQREQNLSKGCRPQTLRDGELKPFRKHLAPLWRCWKDQIW